MVHNPSTTDYPPELAGFASIIATYEHRAGHACRAVASHIPALLTGLPSTPVILDNAYGTGAVTEEPLEVLPSARIYAADTMSSMVQAMEGHRRRQADVAEEPLSRSTS